MTDDKPTITIYTDGGCDPNPGPGGWGVVLLFDQNGTLHMKELSGGEDYTTNNRMELAAAIQALRALKKPCYVKLFTDSTYLKNGITQWLPKWVTTNFKKGKIQNVDLWQALSQEVTRHDIEWSWVKGHAGHTYNERADQLAMQAIARIRPALDLANITRVYTRVSCKQNGGLGAWAALIVRPDGSSQELTGYLQRSTANQLDLIAANQALANVQPDEQVCIFTANSYLHDGITRWISGWKANQWRKKEGGDVQYSDLWQQLDQATQRYAVQWVLIKNEARPPEVEGLEAPLQRVLASVKG